MRTLPYTISFRDAKGFIGKMKFFISGADDNTPSDFSSAADTLTVAVEALTNAALQATGSIGFFGIITLTYGTNAEYPAEWMKAVMQFSNGSGQIARWKVPAPKIAIMESDGVTVINDGTSAPVVAFVNAVKNADASGTFVSSESGLPWTHFEGGLVRFGKQPRRFNERIKSSHLVAGEGE
jgi:hypothetical protein